MLGVHQMSTGILMLFTCPVQFGAHFHGYCSALVVHIGPDYTVLHMFAFTGDAVVYGAHTATVVIEANDDANGIFSLEPIEKPVEEGKTNNF